MENERAGRRHYKFPLRARIYARRSIERRNNLSRFSLAAGARNKCGCAAFCCSRVQYFIARAIEIDIPLSICIWMDVWKVIWRDLLNLAQKISRYFKSNFVQINKHSSGHAKRRQKWPPAAGDGRYATFLVSFLRVRRKVIRVNSN